MISKIDKIKIINALKEFQDICEKHDIKFNRYSEDELLEILYLYKAYRTADKPPF